MLGMSREEITTRRNTIQEENREILRPDKNNHGGYWGRYENAWCKRENS